MKCWRTSYTCVGASGRRLVPTLRGRAKISLCPSCCRAAGNCLFSVSWAARLHEWYLFSAHCTIPTIGVVPSEARDHTVAGVAHFICQLLYSYQIIDLFRCLTDTLARVSDIYIYIYIYIYYVVQDIYVVPGIYIYLLCYSYRKRFWVLDRTIAGVIFSQSIAVLYQSLYTKGS